MKHKIRGDFHFHSTHSACQNHKLGQLINYQTQCSLEAIKEIIAAAQDFFDLGYQYLAITNHITDPLSVDRANPEEVDFLLAHLQKINELNREKKCPIRLLSGVEVNIVDDEGNLSAPHDTLSHLDIVIASNHRVSDDLSAPGIKNGIIKAAENKNVDIMGHLTRFAKRLSVQDYKQIIRACEKNNKIIEFNLRAPLSEKFLELLSESEVLLSIGSDTHPEVMKEEFKSLKDYVNSYYKKSEKAIDFLAKHNILSSRIINTFSLDEIKRLKIIK